METKVRSLVREWLEQADELPPHVVCRPNLKKANEIMFRSSETKMVIKLMDYLVPGSGAVTLENGTVLKVATDVADFNHAIQLLGDGEVVLLIAKLNQ